MAKNMSTIELCARMAHEVNSAYCQALGDDSQVPWEQAPEWQRESAIEGALKAIENPEQTPERSHESWMQKKREDGWVYGETKDPEAKTHPCMVPYEELPTEQRAKDYLFIASVREAYSLLTTHKARRRHARIVTERSVRTFVVEARTEQGALIYRDRIRATSRPHAIERAFDEGECKGAHLITARETKR